MCVVVGVAVADVVAVDVVVVEEYGRFSSADLRIHLFISIL